MRFHKVCLSIVATSILILPLLAQQPPGEIAYFVHAKPKPGAAPQFEEALKEHMNWHGQQNDTWEWHVWQFETGEQAGQYLALTAGHRWEDFDAKDEFMARDRADAMSRIGPYMDFVSSWFSRFRTEMSNWPEDSARRFVQVVMYRLKPGRSEEFVYAAEKIHQALQKANWPQHYLWEQVVAGVEGPQLNLVLPMSKWADMNPPARPFAAVLEEVLGRRETDALLESVVAAIESQRSEILRYRPDLSYLPAGR